MKVFRIKKKRGSYRTIYAPSGEEKEKLRRCLPALHEKQVQVDVSDVAHGFRAGRSPVTNAMQHRGYTYTLSFDLADFFDSVTVDKILSSYGNWSWTVGFYRDCYVDTNGEVSDGGTSAAIAGTHAARQGLPTSPLIANIASARMDQDICDLNRREPKVRRMGGRFVYTRYADDLTFSFGDESLASSLMISIPEIVERYGFKINEAKTHLQCSKAGRRIITGIAVDDELHPTRAVKRRLRAMLHQGHKQQAQGLAEWASLKVPKGYAPRPQLKPVKAKAVTAIPINKKPAARATGEPVDTTRRRFTPE